MTESAKGRDRMSSVTQPLVPGAEHLEWLDAWEQRPWLATIRNW